MFGTILAALFMILLFSFVGAAMVCLFEVRRELKRFRSLCDILSIHLNDDE